MTIKAKCYCGATEFDVSAVPTSVTECNCTFCSKRGALWAYYQPEEVNFIQSNQTTAYAAGEGSMNEHHHCTICGCSAYTMTVSWNEDFTPGDPRIAVNARLFEDFDLSSVLVEHVDGLNQW